MHHISKPYPFVRESWRNREEIKTLGFSFDWGWGNGYVAIPKGHPYYGRHYDDIDVRIHGGLTYGRMEDGMWVIGFDTAHGGDTLERWSELDVKMEAARLWDQVMAVIPPMDKTKVNNFIKRLRKWSTQNLPQQKD